MTVLLIRSTTTVIRNQCVNVSTPICLVSRTGDMPMREVPPSAFRADGSCRAARLGLSSSRGSNATRMKNGTLARTPARLWDPTCDARLDHASSHAFTRRARASCRSRLRPPPSPGMTIAPAPTPPDRLRLRSDPAQAARCRRTRGRAAGRRRGRPRPLV